MKNNKKIFVLVPLLVMLALVATYALTGNKKSSQKKRGRAAIATEIEDVSAELPSGEDLDELVGWLLNGESEAIAAMCPNTGVIGLEGAMGADPPTEEVAEVPTKVPFVEPPKLEGVIWRGPVRAAVFQGERYARGQRVRNTDFRIVDIGRSWVKLRSPNGRKADVSLLN